MGVQQHAQQQRDHRRDHERAALKAKDVAPERCGRRTKKAELLRSWGNRSLGDGQALHGGQQGLQVRGGLIAMGLGAERWLIAAQFDPQPLLIFVLPQGQQPHARPRPSHQGRTLQG